MKKIFKFLIFVIIMTLLIWSFIIEPNKLVVTKYKLNDEHIKNIRIVFAGDFHIKPEQKQRLRKTVNLINVQNPDLILITGDFVAGHKFESSMPIEDISKELSELKSKYGVFVVLGNHDWWQNGDKITKELNNIGFKVLANGNKTIDIKGQKLYIAGVEDLITRYPDLKKALNGTCASTILLTHSPDIFPKVPKDVSLTLAGHTHGGQVVIPFIGPIIVPSKYFNKYAQGLVVEDGKQLIVTRGIGTSILPLRFNCKPEIVVIDF